MHFRRNSADCHTDLIWPPPNRFVPEAPKVLKERMSHVTDRPDGPRRVLDE
jgi:hypothetical protein